MKSLIRILTLSVAVVILSACQSGPLRTTSSAIIVPTEGLSQLDCDIQWQVPLALGSGAKFTSIQQLGNLVVALDTGSILTVLDAKNGQPLWSQQVTRRGATLFAPSRTDEAIVVASLSDLYVYRIANGELMHRWGLEHVISTTPVLDQNVATCVTNGGLVMSMDWSNGLPMMSYQMSAGITVPPVVVNKTVIAADTKGTVAAMGPLTGNLYWRKTGPPWDGIVATLAHDDDYAYMASLDGALYAFSRTTRPMKRYLTPSPLHTGPVLIGGNLYQQTTPNADVLISLDAGDFSKRWTAKDVPGKPIMVRNGRLYVAQKRGVTILDDSNGEVLEHVSIPDADFIFANDPMGGDIVFANNDGRILKISPRP